MSVSDRVRQIEREIYARIRDLPIWHAPKADVLGSIVLTYRDAIELVFGKVLHAETFDASPEEFGALVGQESRFRAGALWALKWAPEYCPEIGAPTNISPKELAGC